MRTDGRTDGIGLGIGGDVECRVCSCLGEQGKKRVWLMVLNGCFALEWKSLRWGWTMVYRGE